MTVNSPNFLPTKSLAVIFETCCDQRHDLVFPVVKFIAFTIHSFPHSHMHL